MTTCPPGPLCRSGIAPDPSDALPPGPCPLACKTVEVCVQQRQGRAPLQRAGRHTPKGGGDGGALAAFEQRLEVEQLLSRCAASSFLDVTASARAAAGPPGGPAEWTTTPLSAAALLQAMQGCDRLAAVLLRLAPSSGAGQALRPPQAEGERCAAYTYTSRMCGTSIQNALPTW